MKIDRKNKSVEKEKIYKSRESNINKIFPGDSSESPDVFNIVVFIDNAYLLRLKKYFFSSGISFSLKRFVENIAKNNNLFVKKIYLYDAPPFQDIQPSPSEKDMKKTYDKFITRFKKQGIIVREGRTQRLKIDDSFIYRQKGVDMLLGIDAVGILNDFPNLENIVLLTGDSDFVPIIEKLREIGVKTILWTYFDRKRNSPFSRCNELLDSVEKFVMITKEDFENAKNEN